jgi:hypothetical protein
VSNISVIDIDTDIVYLRRKPDFALISGDKCLLFEIKTSSLKLDARTLFEEKTLREEVRSGSLEKSIRQLHEFKKAILERRLKDQRFGNINRVISIMIGYEEVFVLNSSVLPLMEEYYPELAEDLQFGCILDLETMGSSLASGNDLVNEIISKLENGSKYYPIDGYLINQKKIKVKNPITTNAFNEFINLMLGKMP